ncbi:MAG: 6-carboxytetrahydropterin synthase QueD [bacterium]|nr:6-carboxytetrahydropterin synthase QueD [bacterium]
MYELIIHDYFSSAHNLQGYKGKCENLHGHNWKVEVVIGCRKLNAIGMAVDFKILKKYLKSVLDLLDHKYLNEIPYFRKKNPSAENIAEFIYLRLQKPLKSIKNITLKKVITWEGQNSGASFYKK